VLVALVPVTLAGAAALAGGGLARAWKWLPRGQGPVPPPVIPPMGMRLRLAAAFALAAAILWSAPVFGPVVSGILLSMPVTGSIMPPFTLALYGPGALTRLTRGFVVGLCGFSAFFFVVAASVVAWGIPAAFLTAVAAALAALYAANRGVRLRRA
jgi:hypothetical protein